MADKTINEEAGLGPEWQPIDVAPIVPGKTPPLPGTQYSQSSRYLQGSIPPSFQHDTAFVDTETLSPSAPKFSLMPLGVNGSPVSNAAIASTVTKVINSSSPGVLLETNGAPNPDQATLNLKAGANTILTPDGAGGVTIAGTASGDGLLHGSLPWEIDPSFVMMRDDFIVKPKVATGNIGELGWFYTGSAVNYPNVFSAFPSSGAFPITMSSSTADTGANLSLVSATDTVCGNALMPLLDYPGWTSTWVFYLGRPLNSSGTPGTGFLLTHMSMYVGWGAEIYTGAAFTARPSAFMGVRYDTDTTAPSIGDTTFWLEAVTNGDDFFNSRINYQGTQGGAFNTGMTPTEGKEYRLTISCAAAGTVQMSLSDGSTTASTSFTVSQFTVVNSATTSAVQNDNNGVAGIYQHPSSFSFSNGLLNLAPGSLATISGLTVGAGAYNGTQKVYSFNAGGGSDYFNFLDPSGGATGIPSQPYNVVGYSGYTPWASLFNDSTGGTSNLARALYVDFFGFVWNPGLAGVTTTNPVKPRYV